ncbi:AAA family ATPase [Amycolatopsis japonica]|uniref:AAA family ATPase n=1 Tax=Amycolatopsis japonica TaxID=208439 RepID=UPI003333B896
MHENDPGAPADADLPARVRWSSGFVGRHPQLKAIHDVLSGDTSPAVLVITGGPGIGKSSLVAKYAHLHRNAYPGGIFWTGPFRQHPPEDFLSRFHLDLARVATEKFGLDVRGTSLTRLRQVVADRLSATRALVVIDDLPLDLPPSVLDQLLIPSGQVATMLTSRVEKPTWWAPSMELGGLTPHDSLELFSAAKVAMAGRNRETVLRFTERCSGLPFVLHSAAKAIGDGLEVRALDCRPHEVATTVRAELDGLAPATLAVLHVAAALAPVPVPTRLISEVLGLTAEPPMPPFTDMADGGWQVHDVALAVLRRDPARLATFAFRAEPVVLDWLTQDRGGHRGFLIQHAEAVAEWPVRHRIRLLRPTADAYELWGDLAAAGEIRARILTIRPDDPEDLVAAARVELGCGLQTEAVRHAGKAAELADTDHRVRLRAKLIAARALDELGRYAEAEHEFWDAHAPSAGEDVADEEGFRLVLATAVAHRLRGRPADAAALLEPVVDDPRRDFAEILLKAKLEWARALHLTGRPRKARAVADEVVDAYRTAGRGWHADCVEARTVHAEAVLELDLSELRPAAPSWEWSAGALRELKAGYAEDHGRDHPLTLAAAVRADRALLAHGQPRRALAALIATERTIGRVLEGDHPLRCRARHGMALAHGMLREFERQADLLDSILEPQIRLLGVCHPETIETHLDLAIALVLSGRDTGDREVALVETAERGLAGTGASVAKLSAKVMTANWVARLPKPVLSLIVTHDRNP